MKKIALILVASIICLTGQAQINLNKIKKEAEKTYNETTGKGSNKLSEKEVVDGLKEALTVGTGNSSKAASKVDGYNKNPKIRIPFPPEAEKVKKTAINLGMEKKVDKFEVTMNRAAEEAAKEAKPIFVNAIKSMTVKDGWAILKGDDNAATEYLDKTTSAQLTEKFTPIVKKAIDKVKVTSYWNPIITAYNRVPGVEKQNPDLEAYITERAIAGLFVLIAEEEKKIRDNPAARVTDLLKKVFSQQ